MSKADNNNTLGCQGEWKKMQDEVWQESVTLEMLLFCKSNTFVQYLPTWSAFSKLFWLQEIALYCRFLWCFFQEDRGRNNPIKWKQTMMRTCWTLEVKARDYTRPQDIDVASIEPIQSFLSLYIYYYIMEEEGCQRRKWVGRHGDAFADIFLWRILGYTYQHCMRCEEKL